MKDRRSLVLRVRHTVALVRRSAKLLSKPFDSEGCDERNVARLGIHLLGGTPKAADEVIKALRKKGWLERAAWGKYLLVPPEQGSRRAGR